MKGIRIGHGYDIHAFGEGLPLRIGGVNVPFEKGCIAHSDGDVAVHALCDALLGSVAAGDIGSNFPDSSMEYKGIDSVILLERTVAILNGKGYMVSNADITVALQAPKIGKYIPQMRAALARAMGIGEDRVSVKATTTENLGFVGRGEGIEAYAVALVQEK